ncbi:amidohydrolase family protein [Cognataquiflexum rubidum]|uniref:amidohydrolase family protein n=1 Tax=Cognataquiflexum rubidum TaxID=2922273 RepID=UPI001F13E728|nr:amidohydrolase family protein [Cognataquiflexum rubidum]MCH6233038.1 amidohydrolase family protein [Cognataquiflexum rubidum]
MSPKIQVFKSILVLVLFLSFQYTKAQSDPSGEKRVTGTIAIKNATITTAPGKTIQNGTILIKNGLIEAVGTNITIPKEAQVISADSLFIYPGFIDGASTAGVGKAPEPEKPSDYNPANPPDDIAGITPWRNVIDTYDNKNNQIQDWRKSGFTIAQLIPEGGMMPGKTAIVLFGNPSSTNILSQNSALVVKFQGARGGGRVYPGTPLGIMAKFRDVYKNAELASRHGKLFASNNGLNRPEINKTYEAMYPVVDKNIPVLFEANDDIEIRRALSLQKENGFRLILSGVSNVEKVTNEIKAANAQVLLSMKLPDDKVTKAKMEELSEEMQARTKRVQEAYQSTLKQAAFLEAAGIPFGFTSMGAKSGDTFKNLRLMVENGLTENAALAALTINNANILGIQKFAGTLEKGKSANMVILTAPLLDEETQVKHVVADGFMFDYEVKAKKNGNGEKNGTNGAVAIDGFWEYTSDTPAGSSSGTLEIKKEGDSYKGTITYDNPAGVGQASSEMKNISLSGSNLTFSFDVAAGGMSLVVNVSGEVSGDQISGNLSLSEYGSFPMNATKKPKSF